MKFLFVIFVVVCLVKYSKGYLCYECNSTFDKNCFDFSPKYSYYKGVYCDTMETGAENCYAVQVSDRKLRKMFRGCKGAGICERYEEQEQSNIHFKVLSCEECNSHYCNSSDTRHHLTRSCIIALLSFVVIFLFR